MRSVVVVLPASMCAAMPMLRVRSIGYARLGEFGDFGEAAAGALTFSSTASIRDPDISRSVRMKTPRNTIGRRGARINYTITSGNAQMPFFPGPFYGLRRVFGWRCPALDRPP